MIETLPNHEVHLRKEYISEFNHDVHHAQKSVFLVRAAETDKPEIVKSVKDETKNKQTSDRFHMVVYRPNQGRFQGQIRLFNMTSCVASNCDVYVMTSETQHPISADAVILQGNQVPANVPKRAHPKQLYVFANTEPPYDYHSKHSKDLMKSTPELFNWTLTYR